MKFTKIMLLTTASVVATGFENKGGWKKDDSGALVTDSEGNPIYLDSDGRESTIAPGYINRLNTEAATHRKAARDAEAKLKAFGDLDPQAAKDAVAKLQDVDFDNMVNRGEVENVRSQMKTQYEKHITEKEQALADVTKRLERLTLDNAFKSSDFIANKLAMPQDAAMAVYRDRFKVEGDKVIPLDGAGNPLINKHGDVASVDEALETYIGARADKDQWIKAAPAGGSGSQGGAGGHGGGNRMKRADFDALAPMDQAAIGKKVAGGEIQIVD